MKKAILLLIVIIVANRMQAQTEKGDWMVGGSMTINTTSDNSQFSFIPSGGYFFARGFVAGASVALNFGKTGSQKTSSESVGPFARYYFNLKTPEFKPFLHAEYNIGNLVTKGNGTKYSNTVGSIFLGAGGAFFINSNVALEGVAGYNHAKVQGQDGQDGFLFRLGFQVHLLGHEVARVRGR